MSVQLRAEHFDQVDAELVVMAGQQIVAMAHDIVHHHSDGTGWYRDLDQDPAETARSARALIDQVEAATREARRWLAEGERPARMRALNQHRRQQTSQ